MSINSRMKSYNYYLYGEYNDYGEKVLSDKPNGVIEIDITLRQQNTKESILYEGATYIGLTKDNQIDSSYIVDYNGQRLKVLYVNPFGRFYQVFFEQLK